MGCSGSTSGKDPTGLQGDDLEQEKGHIMISYNHKHKKLTKEIKDVLEKHGYTVWRDIENMGGNIYDGMADAVRKSYVVLVCMSTEYRNSVNCKKEAQYAIEKKKIIVPLVLERNFQKDDWLEFITSGQKYIDFSSKALFEKGMKELIKDLRTYYKKDDDIDEPGEADIPEYEEYDEPEDNAWYDEFIDCSEENGEAEGNHSDENWDVDENQEGTVENNDENANDDDSRNGFDHNGGENIEDEDNQNE